MGAIGQSSRTGRRPPLIAASARFRRRRGVGTVLATAVFIFIMIFSTANLIVWGITQYAGYQTTINQMTQRDQTQHSEQVSISSVQFGGSTTSSNITATGSTCSGGGGHACPLSSQAVTGSFQPILVMNYSTSTQGWTFTRTITGAGVSSGIAGGYDAGGVEAGAIGSPSGPGLIYVGISYFPSSGTVHYQGIWAYRFFLDLHNQFGIACPSGSTGYSMANFTNVASVLQNSYMGASWAFEVPRINPGVISMNATLRLQNSTINNHIAPSTGLNMASGTASSATATTLTDSTQSWGTNQWANYFVLITSGTGSGQSRTVSSNTATQLTVSSAWGTTPDTTSTYTVATTDGGKATGASSTTLSDSGRSWTTNQWQNYLIYIVSGTGSGQWRMVSSNTANTITVSAAWTTTPNTSSHYSLGRTDSGTATSATSTTLVDTAKTWSTNRWQNAFVAITSGTGAGQTRTVSSNTGSDTGAPTGATGTTLSDTTKSWTTNQWQNALVTITAGTGSGQSRTVSSNTATQLTVSSAWGTTPDTTSTYTVASDILTVSQAWSPTPDATSHYVIGKTFNQPYTVTVDKQVYTTLADQAWNNHKGLKISTNPQITSTSQVNPVNFTVPAGSGKLGSFFGVACRNNPNWFTVQVVADFTATQSANPAETRLLFDDVGAVFRYPGYNPVAHTLGNENATSIMQLQIGSIETAQPGLLTSMIITSTSAYNVSNTQQIISLRDFGSGVWNTVSQSSVSLSSTTISISLTGVDAQRFLSLTTNANGFKYVLVRVQTQNLTPFRGSDNATLKDFYQDSDHITFLLSNSWSSTSHVTDLWVIDSSGHHCFSSGSTCGGGNYAWSGVYVPAGQIVVVTLTYTWVHGAVTLKAETDLGNLAILQTTA